MQIVIEIFVAVLACFLVFALYLSYSNRRELFRLQKKIDALEIELALLRKLSRKREKTSTKLPPDETKPPKKTEKIFVQVIFNKDSKKYYHYFLGNNPDVQVGDFVEVYSRRKGSAKSECRVAQVIYISKPGETSEFARSNIKGKAKRPKW